VEDIEKVVVREKVIMLKVASPASQPSVVRKVPSPAQRPAYTTPNPTPGRAKKDIPAWKQVASKPLEASEEGIFFARIQG
jgi:hypothetical protein